MIIETQNDGWDWKWKRNLLTETEKERYYDILNHDWSNVWLVFDAGFTLYIIYNSKFYRTTIMKNGPNSNLELIVNI